MFSKEDEISKFSSCNKDIYKAKKGKSIINSIFELYCQLYHSKSIEEKSLFSQKATKSIESGIWSCQIASLLWIPSLSIANWNQTKKIWEFIGYSRLDNIFSDLDLLFEFFYLSITITFVLFLSYNVLLFITYRSFILPRLVFDIFNWVFNLWTIMLFIPSTVIFSIFLKYNFLPQKFISEYKNNNDSESFELSIAWQIFIVLAMIINFLMILFYTEFSGEMRHFASEKIIKAKAHSKIDVHTIIFTYFSAMICVLFDENNIIYFQLAEMIISILIIIEIIVLLPYFSYYSNLMLTLQFLTVAFISFGFILGNLIDNSLFIILITIFLWPLSVLFAIQITWLFQKKLNSKPPIDLTGIKSKYLLEKSLRQSLCKNDIENKSQIIYLFEKFFLENVLLRDKLQGIWMANYCLFTLRDESLAKFKLCKSKKILEWNLETNFQEYLCSINAKCTSPSESTEFIDYFQQLMIIKNQDFKLCAKLLKFWEEIISHKPSLCRLTKSLDWLDKRILFLNSQYTDLTAKFFYSKEFLSLYASFSKDVLFDQEKSNFLENKLKSTDINIISSYPKSFSWFNDINGVLIISAEEESFGQILFSNITAKSITKLWTIDEINIVDIIPSYYREKMKEELNNILHYSSTGEIDLSEGLFLNLNSNFITECVGKVFITSIDNFFIFMLIFKQKEAKNEIALISENGEIYGHSKNFPKAVKINSENLTGFNIKKLFSEEKEFDLQWSVPYYLQNCENETLLIFSWTYFYKLKVLYALLINDYEEIQIWKKNNSALQEEFALNRKLSLKQTKLEEHKKFSWKKIYKLEKESTRSDLNLSPEIINDTTDDNYNLLKIKDEEDKYLISENPRYNNFLNQALLSTQSINILHAAFIISIIAVLSTNISVLFFAFSNINFIRNMDLPIVIGKIEKAMQNIACTVEILWLFGSDTEPSSQIILYQAKTLLSVFVDRLKSLYLNVTSNIEDWNYCSGQHIFYDKSINAWNSGINEKTNLFNMILEFIQMGNKLAIKFNRTEYISEEASFLIINGYGEAFRHCNSSLHEVIECQSSIMSDFKAEMRLLLLLGICVLALCSCAIIPFGYSAIKYESKLWNNLRKKVYDNYSELKQSLLERIKNTHLQHEVLLSNKKSTKKSFYFRNYWKYIWRISVYALIATMFSVTSITYLYEKCTDYLTYRPEVMKELIYEQILQNSLVIWTMNSQFEIWGVPLVYRYPNAYPFMDSIAEFEEFMPKLGHSKLVLRNSKYLPILSTKFRKIFYEHIDNSPIDYFEFGAYTAQEMVKIDSYLLAYTDQDPLLLLNWVFYIVTLSDSYDMLIDEIDLYSQTIIEDQMAIIIGTFVVFAICSILIYFTLYFVFFKKEKLYLQKIRSIMKIVPT
ncbi:unnamed protein product [Blepharisma stoltei]|uniref:TmcB/TmcC TPR repeats domain-containing protein n=1 Tax=Blepharisma stoltei TaxID=1481888 RepID=A0AAU9ISE1_9CILI|nr:unnamed protein product [Blepharisma stoltei]